MYTKLNIDQKKLIENNLPYVYWWFDKHHIYDEDKRQNLLLAICSHIHLYDPERGTITTFLNAILTSAILNLYKSAQTQKNIFNSLLLSFKDVLYTNDAGEDVTIEDVIGNSDINFNNVEVDDLHKYLLKKLKNNSKIKEKDFKIFVAYLNVGNMREVGKMYSCSFQYVSKVVNKVRNLIKSKGWVN